MFSKSDSSYIDIDVTERAESTLLALRNYRIGGLHAANYIVCFPMRGNTYESECWKGRLGGDRDIYVVPPIRSTSNWVNSSGLPPRFCRHPMRIVPRPRKVVRWRFRHCLASYDRAWTLLPRRDPHHQRTTPIGLEANSP